MGAPDDVNLEVLSTLIAVFETGQFTAAAAELRISQPTVSKRIATLEHMMGVPLFTRHVAGDVVATHAGRQVYDAAVSICATWSDLMSTASRGLLTPTSFTLLLSHTASSTLLPGIVEGLQPEFPSMDFRVRTMNSDSIAQAIIGKQAQMGIVEKTIDTDSVDLTALREDRLTLAGCLDLEYARDTVWLVREPGSGVRYYTDLFLRISGLHPRATIELDSNEKICAVLAEGIGCSVISQDSVPPGVPTSGLGSEFVRHFYALTPKTGLNSTQKLLSRTIMGLLRR
ncbi:MAG: LysR family transcriptional regulator [Bifidobacterium sp.]|jgi:DNA-binding transcriptional LysR family regulator|nr:LysR family transcriptional regulator [Bifidobacterium sp.]MCI1864948.1 LysR family transcriptional regulator [Bifidobacterium sp.]